MSKKKHMSELDKSERIMKHERSHSKDGSGTSGAKRLKPNHKPAKKNHINILDAYEKMGEDYEDLFED